MTSSGIKQYNDKDSSKAAMSYMKENNVVFPEHKNFNYQERSGKGGAFSGLPLAKDKNK